MCSMGFFNNRSGNSFIFILFASNNNECVVIVKTTNSTATKIQTDALLLKKAGALITFRIQTKIKYGL